MGYFLNNWKGSVKTIVQRDASLIEILFLIKVGSLSSVFASSEILSK